MSGGYQAELTYSVRELHEMTGVPTSVIYRAIRTGRLAGRPLPGFARGTRIKESEAARYFGWAKKEEDK